MKNARCEGRLTILEAARRGFSDSFLDPKLRGKVVEILRDYVKISVLRCVCLAFRSPFKRTWNEGRSESNGSSPC